MTNPAIANFAKMVASRPRHIDAAYDCADDLERLDMTQTEEAERQSWSPAYKAKVAAIIGAHMRALTR